MNYSKLFKPLFLFFVWGFCFLLLAEISLRTIGYFYSKRPKLDEISSNQTFNIVCLGDSFTYGIGVGPAHSYPRQLEGMLNSGNLTTVQINVIASPEGAKQSQKRRLRSLLRPRAKRGGSNPEAAGLLRRFAPRNRCRSSQ